MAQPFHALHTSSYPAKYFFALNFQKKTFKHIAATKIITVQEYKRPEKLKYLFKHCLNVIFAASLPRIQIVQVWAGKTLANPNLTLGRGSH